MPTPIEPMGPLGLDDTRLSQLAYELARDIYPAEAIFRAYGIDVDGFNTHIKDNRQFMSYFAEAHLLWNSSNNIAARSALKAGVMFEQWLGKCNTYFNDAQLSLAPKVEMLKFMGRIAGFEPTEKSKQIAGGVSVTINLNHAVVRPQTIVLGKVDERPPEVMALPIIQADGTPGVADGQHKWGSNTYDSNGVATHTAFKNV